MTCRSLTRKASLLGFTAGTLVLSMTGSAYACTYFYGKLTVTATSPTDPLLTSSAFTDGAGGYSPNALEEGGVHGYCPIPAPVDNRTGSAASAAYPAQGMYKAETFGLQVGPTTTCVTQNQLTGELGGNATHDVRWLNMKNAVSQYCVSPNNDAVIESKGSITLTDGVGSGVFPQGTAAAGEVVKVCIRNDESLSSTGASAPDVKLLMI